MFIVNRDKHDTALENLHTICTCGEYHDSQTIHCSFCGAGIPWSTYGTHLAKAHPGGGLFKPFPVSKLDAALVFAQWQQRDATPEELAEWD